MVKTFKSAAAVHDAIEFKLDKDSFTFDPPKRAGFLLSALLGEDDVGSTKRAFDWITKGLDAEHYKADNESEHATGGVKGCQACIFVRRLADDDDPLDVDIIGELFTWLVGEVSGRPSGKQSD